MSRTISHFQTTCGCLQLDPPGRTIASGDKAEFTAHLDLLHRLSYQLGAAQWPVLVRLDPVFEGDLAPTPGWEVIGVARSRVSLNKSKLAFADRCAHSQPRVWQKVRAKANVPLTALRASVAPESAEVRIESSGTSAEDYFIFVSPNPTLPIGRFRFEVQLEAVMDDGATHPCVAIEVVGEMQPPSRVIPRLVLLGEHKVPSEAEADVTLRLPSKDWKIDHIETDKTETLVTQNKGELSEGVRLHITQQIKQLGDHVSTIRISVRKPEKRMEMVSVEVPITGKAAPINDSRRQLSIGPRRAREPCCSVP
jgi:hypothetical protein